MGTVCLEYTHILYEDQLTTACKNRREYNCNNTHLLLISAGKVFCMRIAFVSFFVNPKICAIV